MEGFDADATRDGQNKVTELQIRLGGEINPRGWHGRLDHRSMT